MTQTTDWPDALERRGMTEAEIQAALLRLDGYRAQLDHALEARLHAEGYVPRQVTSTAMVVLDGVEYWNPALTRKAGSTVQVRPVAVAAGERRRVEVLWLGLVPAIEADEMVSDRRVAA